MDYRALGFKAGLEIHQQLATKKLFCKCSSELTENYNGKFERVLRPTQSELGELDKAALEEARRKRRFIYYVSSSSCLVEADEEPPHEANEEAINVALTVALLLKADIVDEIHFMRKIVIDGSNTTGFQRTALIALNGKIDGIKIETICLEEDAARKLKENGKKVEYALDRLGIPLIEIATSPDISSPEEAKKIAEKIGLILRATKKVRRGIGTIRQDLNISIKEGNRVEIKGVQELNDIPKILENEVKRQLELIEVAKKLKEVKEDDIEKQEIKDVSNVFEKTQCKFIRKALKNGKALAIKLPNFSGLIGGVKYKEHRLGKEFATRAKIEGGGIIHSDELPAYGISEKEVKEVKKILGCSEKDAFIISVGNENIAKKCLKAVKKRAIEALKGVPKEVRRALPDGFTEYMRPMPTAARMYPETDIPPIRITRERLAKIKKSLPEMPEKRIERMCNQYRISYEEAKQLVYGGKDDIFEELVKKYRGYERIVARILLNILAEMEKEGYNVEVALKRVNEVLEGLNKKLFAKEAIDKLLRYLAENPEAKLDEAIQKCKAGFMEEKEIRKIIKTIIEEKEQLIKEKKERAFSPLMGLAMKELRGKADGAIVSKILKEELEKIIHS